VWEDAAGVAAVCRVVDAGNSVTVEFVGAKESWRDKADVESFG